MIRIVSAVLALLCLGSLSEAEEPFFAPIEGEKEPEPSIFNDEILPILDIYCVDCHGNETHKANVNFEAYSNDEAVQLKPKFWEGVVEVLRAREMPPEKKDQPTEEEREGLAMAIERTIANIDLSKIPKDPGHATARRLNRAEYNNSVRDLFGVDFKPADKFPTDAGGGGGFDNNADTLFVQPLLMEKYLEAAREVVERASDEVIFFAEADEIHDNRDAARVIVSRFARRAFRRPVEDAEIDRLMGLYDGLIDRGGDHEAGVKLALRGVLVSPSFLFRTESLEEGKEPVKASDIELASRLSYFIWSSIPDEELLSLAEKGELSKPEVLEAQIERMIADPKSRALAENFGSQWLEFSTLVTTTQPDPGRFKMWTDSLRDAMYEESVRFIHEILTEDRSLLEILDADFTYLNEELAKHYGIEGVEGGEMRRVELPQDSARGGILTHGSVLTVASHPLRTSPVLRGKWVLSQIIGAPPPPPPPDVPEISKDDQVRDGLTLRERLEQHRDNPACASCHNRMDPIGFSLENFDAVGRWRSEENGKEIDTKGRLNTGEEFEGPEGLKRVLAETKRDDITRNMVEKMLSYALGRGLEYYDLPTIIGLQRELEKDGYKSHILIKGVATSFPFLYKRTETLEQTKN